MHRFLIVGYGVMGVRHAMNLRESGLGEVAGVYDPNPQSRLAAREAGLSVCDSLDALLEVPADCAVVATPNDTHHRLACQLLRSGRHVMVEKPAAMSCEALAGIYAVADAAKRIFTVHQNRRWDQDFVSIRRVIDDNLLGRLTRMESRIHGSRGIPAGWRRQRSHGGGMLYDWGPHLVDQVLLAFDGIAPEALFCQKEYVLQYEVEDGFRLILQYPEGLSAFIEVGTCNYIALPRFYLCGRDGTAIIDDWRNPCRIIQCTSWSDGSARRRAPGHTSIMSERDGTTVRRIDMAPQPVSRYEYLRNFCAAVRGEEAVHVTRMQAMRLMYVLEAAAASAASGQLVKLRQSCEGNK